MFKYLRILEAVSKLQQVVLSSVIIFKISKIISLSVLMNGLSKSHTQCIDVHIHVCELCVCVKREEALPHGYL